ncbi:MAG: flagellar basal body protein [Rhizobiaceae bacterium]|jgi:flagellar basal-body rod protein FlgB|nr:flagellar basal body protein [Rhizobiaceae bacterium]
MNTLLEVASLQARWLAARQAVTAENIANASTPGFVARDVTAFDEALRKIADAGGGVATVALRPDDAPWTVRPSGNSVSVEEELIRGGSINRAHALNTGIVGAFHRMMLSAARG